MSWSYAYLIFLENVDALFCNLVSCGTNQMTIQYFMISNYVTRILTLVNAVGSGSVRNKQKIGGPRIAQEYTNNTMYA
jgi:hypothetical protein